MTPATLAPSLLTVPPQGTTGTGGMTAAIRALGALTAVGALFSGAANWGWNAGVLPAPPIAAMATVAVAAIASLLLDGAGGLRWSIAAWAVASAATAMAGFLWSSGSDVALQETQTRILSAIQLVALLVLLSHAGTRSLTRIAIVASTLLAVAINVWEVTHPLTFSIALGRSAGLYVNPNLAGAALIAGMTLGLPALAPALREAYVLVCGAGVLTTLSRGALLCWVLVVLMLILWRGVRASRLAAMGGAGLVAGLSIAGALLAGGQLSYLGGGAERFVRQRLAIGNRDELGADVSASSRSALAMRALEMFGERPLTGHGTGATIEWHEAESTHNVYARQLAEYGVAGAWLAPGLLVLVWLAVRRSAERAGAAPPLVETATARAFVLFVALWGVFSHNVLDDAFVLIGIALVAARTDRAVVPPPAAGAAP